MYKTFIQEQVFGGFAPRRNARPKQVDNNNVSFDQDQIGIEDLLKQQQDISNIVMKTPVSILQELLNRRGLTPYYELIQIEGSVHEPIFRYNVSVKDKNIQLTALGTGNSKKKAKHLAAKALIYKLNDLPISDSLEYCTIKNNDNITTDTENENYNNTTNFGGGDSNKINGNPISLLQEMCIARKLPPPTYETEMEVGLPHERQFIIACKIFKYCEIGKGRNKKIAKRLAAHKMWIKLQMNPLNYNQINELLDNNDNKTFFNTFNYYNDLKNAQIPIITNSYCQKITNFQKTLQNSIGEKINKLHATSLNNININYVKFLEEIANENHFTITYVDVDEKTYNGYLQCFVKLSTLPVVICHGSGKTLNDAKSNAAHNALEYLKIIIQK